MDLLREGLILTAEGMAATFIICGIVIGLSALVRKLSEISSPGEKSGTGIGPVEEESTNDDAERVAVIAAVTAAMNGAPFKIRSIDEGVDYSLARRGDMGGEWERSVREEMARTQGGNE